MTKRVITCDCCGKVVTEANRISLDESTTIAINSSHLLTDTAKLCVKIVQQPSPDFCSLECLLKVFQGALSIESLDEED